MVNPSKRKGISISIVKVLVYWLFWWSCSSSGGCNFWRIHVHYLLNLVNFIISGNATEWYVREGKTTNCCLPVSRLFKFNFGSVVGGSFLNAFFNFIDFLFETFRCYPDGCCGVCAPCSTAFSKCCGCFFDLVRNDAYAYINLTGIPYCNAARNC